jgi:hypothetical protein
MPLPLLLPTPVYHLRSSEVSIILLVGHPEMFHTGRLGHQECSSEHGSKGVSDTRTAVHDSPI